VRVVERKVRSIVDTWLQDHEINNQYKSCTSVQCGMKTRIQLSTPEGVAFISYRLPTTTLPQPTHHIKDVCSDIPHDPLSRLHVNPLCETKPTSHP
jgi:hypothetical protein